MQPNDWKYYDPSFDYEIEYENLDSTSIGHRHFVYDLTVNTQPKNILLFGDEKGAFLFSFAQALKDNKISAKIFALNNSEKSGSTKTLKKIKKSFYKNQEIIFSKKNVNQAIQGFENNSVDVLLINTEYLTEDLFNLLEIKLTNNAILLLNRSGDNNNKSDINSYIKKQERKFLHINFSHSGKLLTFFSYDKFKELNPFTQIWQNYYQLKAFEYKSKFLLSQNKEEKITISSSWKNYRKIQKTFHFLNKKSNYVKILKYLKKYGLKGTVDKYFEKLESSVYRENYNLLHNMWVQNNYPGLETLEKHKLEIKKFKYSPKISIIMPTYNPPLREFRICIESVLKQSYENWELCIADDFSSNPEVTKLIEEYAKKDKRIKYVLRNKNGHISAASNTALKIATGSYIGLLDHDDVLWPNALYEVVKLINSKPNTDLIYSDEDKVDLYNKHFDPHRKKKFSPVTLLGANYITHFCVIKNSIFKKIGGFREGYEGSQDYDLFLRITQVTDKIEHIPKILYSWRALPESTASLNDDIKPYAYDSAVLALQDHIDQIGIRGTISKNEARGLYNVNFKSKIKKIVAIIVGSKNIESWKHTQKELKNVTLKFLSTSSELNEFNFDNSTYYIFFESTIVPPNQEWIDSTISYAKIKDAGILAPVIKDKTGNFIHTGFENKNDVYYDKLAGRRFGKYMEVNYTLIVCEYDAVTLNGAVLKGNLAKELDFGEYLSLSEIGLSVSKKMQSKYRIVRTPQIIISSEFGF